MPAPALLTGECSTERRLPQRRLSIQWIHLSMRQSPRWPHASPGGLRKPPGSICLNDELFSAHRQSLIINPLFLMSKDEKDRPMFLRPPPGAEAATARVQRR
jgi:hypothetical protein